MEHFFYSIFEKVDCRYICTELVLLLILFQTGLTDIKSRRIANEAILSGLVFLLPFCKPGNIISATAIGMIFMFLWRLGLLGGGDVKLFMLIFLAKGIGRGLITVFMAMLIAGVISLISLIASHQLLNRMKRLWCFLNNYMEKGGGYISSDMEKEYTVPLAACMYFSELLEIFIWNRLWQF